MRSRSGTMRSGSTRLAAAVGVLAVVLTVVVPGTSSAGPAEGPTSAPAADGRPADPPGSAAEVAPGPAEAAPGAPASSRRADVAVLPGLTPEEAAQDPALSPTDLSEERPSPEAIGALSAAAAQSGTVRVLVTVRTRHVPQGLLTAGAVADQRSAVADLQSRVISGAVPLGATVHHTYDANIPTIAMTVTPAALEELERNPAVARVEEDVAQPAMLEQSVPLIGAADAQDRGFRGSGWTVAVLDTGADSTHPLLRGATVEEACFSTVCPGGGTSSTAAGSGAQCTYANGCNHGTHVSGIAIGLATADRPLRAGVADLGLLMPIQVFSQFTGTACSNAGEDPCTLSRVSDQLAALNHVFSRRTARNIAAVNMSLGGGANTVACDSDTRKAAIDNLRSEGIATVISSGNDSYINAVGAPGCISTAITVGATDDADNVANFSNASDLVDVLAPGVGIESSVPGGGYANFDGTSMAAPHVAGAIAIMKSRTPSMSVDLVESFLESTGKPVTDTAANNLVKPRIQVLKAIFEEVDDLANDVVIDHRNPIPTAHRYSGVTTVQYWSAVAIRPPSTGDFDLDVYDVFNDTGLLASSAGGGNTIDFVAQDSNNGRRAFDFTFPSVRRFSGTGRYQIEYDNQGQTIGDGTSAITMGSSEIIEVRDSFHTAGVPVHYRVVPANGGQDAELLLMSSTAGVPGTYVQGRSAAVASSSATGPGGEEAMSSTSSASQYNGLVVVNRSGSGAYNLYRDSSAPTGSVNVNSGAATTNTRSVTLQLSASDGQTGINAMRISTTSAADLASQPWVPFAPSATRTLPGGAGSKTVWVQYRNNAHGPSAVVTDAITLNAVIQPGSASVTEGNSGTKVVNVPVTLSTTSTATVTANWSTGDNGAKAPADYVAASGTVTFSPGQTSKTVAVTIKGDALDEANEGLVVGFNTPTNAVIGGFYGLAPVTIVDDDPLPTVVPGSASVTEGDSGTKVVNVPVTLSRASGRTVSARWSTANNGATAPGDYVAASGTVTFAPGQTSRTVAVTINGDLVTETNEGLVVGFNTPTNAVIGGFYGLAPVTIVNDD